MAVTPVHSTLTVTTAGTRVQVTSNTALKPASVYFEAAAANTGYIYVGLVTVNSTIYITRLSAGQGFYLNSDSNGHARMGGQDIQLSSIYIDSSVNAEKVQMTYMFRTGG